MDCHGNQKHTLYKQLISHLVWPGLQAVPVPFINNFNPLPGSTIVKHPEKFGMPKISPEFFDDSNWFRPFLKFTPISEYNKQYISNYNEYSKNIHPTVTNIPLLQFPDGKQIINNFNT